MGDKFVTRTKLPSLVFLLCPFSCVFLASALGADPAKDPEGWNDVRFGMTQDEVVQALGIKAHLVDNNSHALPLMVATNACVDLPAAKSKANQIISDRQNHGAREVEAAQEFLDLLDARQWKFTESGIAPSKPRSAKPRNVERKMQGTIAEFKDLGLTPNGAHRISVVVAPKKKNEVQVELRIDQLDKESQEYIQKLNSAVSLLSELLRQKERHKYTRLEVDAIRVRGMEMTPDIDFEDQRVAKIYLKLGNFDYPYGPDLPNSFGVHRTLCDALSDKFGPPDETNETASSTRVIWRFPKTVVTCVRRDRGVGIIYQPPSEETDSGDDNL